MCDDTDFSQTEHLDRWNADRRVRFIFGYDAERQQPSLLGLADLANRLLDRAWMTLNGTVHGEDPAERSTGARQGIDRRRAGVREPAIAGGGGGRVQLPADGVRETYRLVVVRKNISVAKREQTLFDRIVYFFYLTNDWVRENDEVVFSANDRYQQENVLAQLLGGVQALTAPGDNPW